MEKFSGIQSAMQRSAEAEAFVPIGAVHGGSDGAVMHRDVVHRDVGGVLSVADAPRFTHRGMLLDLARMYWTMEGVHSVIDAMAYSKLNVLHLVRPPCTAL